MKPIASILVACVVASCLITITAPLGVESVQGASFTQVKCTNSPVKIRACPHVNCPVLFAYPDNVPVFAAGPVSGAIIAKSGHGEPHHDTFSGHETSLHSPPTHTRSLPTLPTPPLIPPLTPTPPHN